MFPPLVRLVRLRKRQREIMVTIALNEQGEKNCEWVDIENVDWENSACGKFEVNKIKPHLCAISHENEVEISQTILKLETRNLLIRSDPVSVAENMQCPWEDVAFCCIFS